MKETRFIFLGDAEPDNFIEPVGYARWKKLVQTAVEKAYGQDPEGDGRLFVLAGDLVRRSRKGDKWTDFFDAADPYFKDAAVIAAIGNHDCRDGIDYLKRLKTPENGPEGFTERFFSYDFECCHFTVLDTNSLWYDPEYDNMPKYSKKYGFDLPPYDPDIAPAGLIADWMDEDLSENEDKVKFILMHHPMFSLGTSEGDDEQAAFMRKNFLPVMKKHGVAAILCGHQHLYCRTDVKKTGILQIMGVSGNKLFDAYDKSCMENVKEFVSVATIFTVNGESMRIETIDADGNDIDDIYIMLT